MTRPHAAALLAAGIALVCGTALAACAPSPQSTYTDADGRAVTVDWRDFPAEHGVDTDLVLTGPTIETTEDRVLDIIEAVTARLGDEFGMHDWEAVGPDGWYSGGGNGYGGESMLTVYNSPAWQSAIVVPRGQWPEVIAAVEEVVSAFGLTLSPPADGDIPDWMHNETFQRGTEWLDVTVQDTRLDDEALRDAEELDTLVAGVTLFYGVATIGDADREEFSERAAPFAGLEHPDPTISD